MWMLHRHPDVCVLCPGAAPNACEESLASPAKMESGIVYYPNESVWYSDLEKEMLQFPAGEHDDQVDALAYGILQTAMRNKFRAY